MKIERKQINQILRKEITQRKKIQEFIRELIKIEEFLIQKEFLKTMLTRENLKAYLRIFCN